MEAVNYLYLAQSKLRTCSIGPELTVTDPSWFNNIQGNCRILRWNEGIPKVRRKFLRILTSRLCIIVVSSNLEKPT
jgi:hypothetical protein